MEYTLKRGQALVLAGPQGCGKSKLARKIAKKHGSFVETDAIQMGTRRGLLDLMESEPKTVIVDGFPADEEAKVWLKSIIANHPVKLQVKPKYGTPKVVAAPHFIFCTSDADSLPMVSEDRRFYVIRLDAAA